jgi:hypothetical protein
MMLIHDEIERPLATIPFDGFEDGVTHTATPNDLNPIDDFFSWRSRELIRVPKDLMPTLHQCGQIGPGHPFRAARQGILRVAPIQHQETHVSQI